MDAGRNSIPLYLMPEMPFCKPIMSHNARSHNVVLKITVPKRTGRKRKRGTDGPWEGDVEINDAEDQPQENDRVSSHARLDDPKVLRRTMADNVDKYQVEAVGVIRNTHRFRGLADFYWDMSKSSFAQQYVDKVLPGDGKLFGPKSVQGTNSLQSTRLRSSSSNLELTKDRMSIFYHHRCLRT